MRETKEKTSCIKRWKTQTGITLIALIVTIIVLLILAGVSIATLIGENGMLIQANNAKNETEKASAEENVKVEVSGSYGTDGKIDIDRLNENLGNVNGLTSGLPISSLPATVEVDGYEILIREDGNVNIVIRMDEYQTADTKPYLPGSEFSHVDGTNLDNGLVATDGINYWTWIEVPISIYLNTTYNGGTAPTGTSDYDTIETILNNYTSTLLSRNGYADTWYDYYGTTYDGTNEYSQVGYITDSTSYATAKEYYGTLYTDTNGTIDTTGSYITGTTYYTKITEKLNDTRGCGLTYERYNSLKNSMLSSVYRNGGFWIGQYEAGTDSYPATGNDTRTVVIQKGVYPYNYITCSNAQKKASGINSGDYTSSLMFGIQWDLVLKHLQSHGVTETELTSNSTSWGNQYNITFEISEGKYTTTPSIADSFIEVKGTYTKHSSSSVLLTTGATERNMKMNIYDLAGNVQEWTLEKGTNNNNYVCVHRGNSFYSADSSRTVSSRNIDNTVSFYYSTAFRPALY